MKSDFFKSLFCLNINDIKGSINFFIVNVTKIKIKKEKKL